MNNASVEELTHAYKEALGGRFLRETYRLVGEIFTYRVVVLLAIVVSLLGRFRDSPMVSGLFALDAWDQFWLSLLVSLLGAQIFVCTRILQLHGGQRFGSESDRTHPQPVPPLRSLVRGLLAAALSVTPVAIFEWKIPEPRYVFIFAGILVGMALFAVSIALENLSSPAGVEQVLPVPLLLKKDAPVLERLSQFVSQIFRSMILKLDRSGVGYISGHRVLSGHLLAFLSTLLVLFLYLAAFFVTLGPLAGYVWYFQPGHVKAIFYALLFLSLCSSAAAFLCFLLDRYRIPVLTLMATAAFVFSMCKYNTHYYELSKAATSVKVDAKALWSGDNKQVIVISAEGGGIQAAAWTTRVLKGIVDDLPPDLRPKFVKSVRLLSGVSGGSVGLMLYQTIYANHQTDQPADYLSRVHEQGLCGDALAWISFGLSYYDLSRGLPYLSYSPLDRGWAAQHAWGKMLTQLGGNKAEDVTLRQLRRGVIEGTQPLLVFNSTAADTGEPVELTNFDLDPDHDFKALNTLYPDKDMKLTTAVRLSAAFPYVTPSPRPYFEDSLYAAPSSPGYALIDGGLYDNFGVAGAYFTLKQAFKDSGRDQKPILWIHIRLTNLNNTNLDDDKAEKTSPLAQSGLGPLLALYNTRGTGQRSRADQLKELAGSQFGRLSQAEFVYPANSERLPLSWALRPLEIEHVTDAWRPFHENKENNEIAMIRNFLNGAASATK